MDTVRLRRGVFVENKKIVTARFPSFWGGNRAGSFESVLQAAVTGQPQSCCTACSETLAGIDSVASVRAISRSHPASLARGSGGQYHRHPGWLGPGADDERRPALFHRGVGCCNAFLI